MSDSPQQVEDQIELISKMIQRTQVNFSIHSFHLVVWGLIIAVGCLIQFILLKIGFPFHPLWIWIMVLPGVLISTIYGFRQAKHITYTTYADRINKWVWIGQGVACMTVASLLMPFGAVVIPVLLVIAGFASFISGKIIDFRPLERGGFILWLFAIFTYLISNEYSLLLMSIAITFGYLIPGVLLRRKMPSHAF